MTAPPDGVAGTEPPPGLTVVVLNYRNAAATLRCLDAVLASSYDGALRVTVVENGSADGSADRLAAYARRAGGAVDLVASARNLGFAGGVNLAWPAVATEYACLLNNDAAVHPECLRRLVATLRARADLGAVWPYDAPMAWRDGLRVPDPAAVAALRNGTSSVTGTNIWLPLLADYRQCFTASGVCLVLRRADVRRPFPDEYFAYYEDVYLGWRLRLLGLGSERVPEAVVYHEGSSVARDRGALRPVLARHAEKNRLTNLLLFYERRTLLALVPLLLLDEGKRLIRAVGHLARFWRRDALALVTSQLRARWWVARHLRWIAAQRRVIQAERVTPDRAILPLLSGRLTPAPGVAARLLNALSLGYCRLIGLPVLERSAGPGDRRP